MAAAATRDASLSDRERRSHGVVHTPSALARFVAERCDHHLKRLGFGGLADERVTVIDPACGPGIFLAAVATVAGSGVRCVGVDRDPAALEVAGRVLSPLDQLTLLETDALESLDVFAETDALVVLGNPPWSGRSASRTPLLDQLLVDFRVDVDGKTPLQERKVGVLSDVYVRFLRWAFEGLRRAPSGGVLGLVTNASFLDGPVHRGMRAAMGRWSEAIEVFDFGGSALTARDTQVDDNVFGVRPAAVATFATRTATTSEVESARPSLVRLWGTRAEKLRALSSATPEALEVPVGAPWRRPAKNAPVRWPAGFVGLDALFEFHREGVQSNRDAAAIDPDRQVLLQRLRDFAAGRAVPPAILERASGHYDPALARRRVRDALASDPDASFVRELAYRPGDTRWFVAIAPLCHRPRHALLQAMDHSAGALLSVRKDRGNKPYTHFGWATHAPDNCFLSARSSCRTRAFPTHTPDGSENLTAAGRDWFASAEEGLLCALAVLASETYRRRFEWLLRQDHPRLPEPRDLGAVVEAGRALRDCLLKGRRDPEDMGERGHWRVPLPEGYREAVARCTEAVALG